jgi:hypothetical protein
MLLIYSLKNHIAFLSAKRLSKKYLSLNLGVLEQNIIELLLIFDMKMHSLKQRLTNFLCIGPDRKCIQCFGPWVSD